MSASVFAFLGSVPELRVAAAGNVANLLAAAGDDVAVLDLQPRTAPPPLCDHGDRGLATALAGERTPSTLATPVAAAPTVPASADGEPFGAGGVSLVPLTDSLTRVVPPEDDPADAAGRVLDDLATTFDAVCAVAPPLPDLVGVDRLWVATLNRTAVRSSAVVGVLDTADPETDRARLRSAARGGVRADCTLAVQSDADAPPPAAVREADHPLQGRIPAADPWADAAADAYREFAERLVEGGLDGVSETPPALVTPGTTTDTPADTDDPRRVTAAAGDGHATGADGHDDESDGATRYVEFAEGDATPERRTGPGAPGAADEADGDQQTSGFRRLFR